MSSAEFAEWLAFDRLEPWGERRMDFRFANLMAQTANLYRKRGTHAFSHQDFMPDFEAALDEVEAQAAIPEHIRLANKVKSIFGGLIGRKKG